jgi:uridine phosphorylase
LVNIDLNTREIKSQHTALNIVRIGTSGALQSDIGIDHVLISEMAIGLDNLLHFYEHKNTSFEAEIKQAFEKHLSLKAYVAQASPSLLALFGACTKGITVTCSGFYAPQGRVLRANTLHKNFIHALHQFKHNEKRITNFEMETAGIYGLAKVLGHEALSVNAILANRITHQFSKQPDEVVKHTIQMVLDTLCDLK